MPHSAMRSVHGNAVATHRHPDAVGKPDHGYVCRHGIGVAASHAIGNARRPARPTRIHNHTSHAPVYNRYGGTVFRRTSRFPILSQAHGSDIADTDRASSDT